MTEPTIELVRPADPGVAPDYFDRGERIIMVDGVRWGRTRVRFHGCHGTTYHFEQEGGHMICRNPAETDHWKEYRWLSVGGYSRRGQWRPDADRRPTEQRVIDTIRDLINTERLRHPNVVKDDEAREHAAYMAERAEKKARRDRAIRERACAALGINNIDEPNDVVDRVVAAMKWAREQF